MNADDPRHGTRNGYNNLGCRCEGCRAAFAAAMREYRARNRQYPVPSTVAHGTANAYQNYGCRCFSCRKAQYERHVQRWVASS